MSRAHTVDAEEPQTATAFTIPLHLLVGATGEESSTGALHVAAAIARRSGASVRVLTVSTPFPHGVGVADVTTPPMLDEENRRAALSAIKAKLETLPDTNEWNVHALVGWPAEAMVDAAERWPASLVVLGGASITPGTDCSGPRRRSRSRVAHGHPCSRCRRAPERFPVVCWRRSISRGRA